MKVVDTLKDGTVKACLGAVLIAIVYSVYIMGNVISGLPFPDGPVFIGVCTTIGAFLGLSKGIEKYLKG